MSTDTATSEHEVTADAHDDDHGAHLTFNGAIRIAAILAVITAVETATYFFDFGSIAKPMILVLMTTKFFVVIGYFMHLKYDNKMFTLVFAIGIVLTLAVFGGVLFSSNLFG